MHLFLSPHYDDAVLSCGGTLHQLAQEGAQVVVRTVMGQNPPANRIPDTPIIRDLHQRWGRGDDPVAARIREDEQAVTSLGGSVQRMMVWPDCVYRTSRAGAALYPTEESLWAGVNPDDPAGQLVPTIVLPPTDFIRVLYAPLGVGGHVDHLIVRDWALALRRDNPSLAVKFYEEYPYRQEPAAVDKALAFYRECGVRLEAEPVALSETNVAAKVQAISRYRSQISTFWTSLDAMEEAVRADLARGDGGKPVERYWRAAIRSD